MPTRNIERVINAALIGDDGVDGVFAMDADQLVDDDLTVDGPLSVAVSLYKVGEAVHLSGKVTGTLVMTCARCLVDYTTPTDEEFSAVYMRRESFVDEGENLDEVELSGEDMDVQFFDGDELDLWPPARDQLILAAPMRPLCKDECRGLCPLCGADLNEKDCGCDRTPTDPRLAGLKKLIGDDGVK